MADNMLDPCGGGIRSTLEAARSLEQGLIRQIRLVEPDYRCGPVRASFTTGGHIERIRTLRLDRAAAYYHARNASGPLQVETLRMLQQSADSAYAAATALYEAGRLRPRLSRQEAIGNYVDRATRRDIRDLYHRLGIAVLPCGPVRIGGREYATYGEDQSYRIPDVRVGSVAFDVSLTRKTLLTPQIRGFFASDFQPEAVIIVRPSQLGPLATYAIAPP